MLTNSDFALDQDQLTRLNNYLIGQAKMYADSGSDPADGVSVTYQFSPYGRMVSVQYDGGTPFDIESA